MGQVIDFLVTESCCLRVHGFELITLIRLRCLRPLVGLGVQLKCRLPVASCIDTFRILSITTCRGQKFYGRLLF